ncbi:hypothetical protein NADFUDRAFT_52880 [Nadsonia fulvescens var. elongata DSM 6958]|uniref:C2H2-type domain-containing protein n=1 Tax=Nadsonia fulvescens var. elongata DSM 6958 TaxID=857566 RepID=A0A1E3PG32_9ASCO|nr:hypothetical protein NADFUDRAFT_52880 [Nadsonia fulvescens var. elongata DSM 6958]
MSSDSRSTEYPSSRVPRIGSDNQTPSQAINIVPKKPSLPHENSTSDLVLHHPALDGNSANNSHDKNDHDPPRSENTLPDHKTNGSWNSSTMQTASVSLAKRSKAKYAKVFQCTGYGDCRMMFTRSEHLARHIRKHTGERPFKCVCTRTFSRLDNLRQHIHTVHANDSARFPMTYPLTGVSSSTTSTAAHMVKLRISPKGGSSPATKSNDNSGNIIDAHTNSSDNMNSDPPIKAEGPNKFDESQSISQKNIPDVQVESTVSEFLLRSTPGPLLRKTRPSPISLNINGDSKSASGSQDSPALLASPVVSPINPSDGRTANSTAGQPLIPPPSTLSDMSVNYKFPPIPSYQSVSTTNNRSPFSSDFPVTAQRHSHSSHHHHHHSSHPSNSYYKSHRNISADLGNSTLSSRSVYSQAFPPTTPLDSPGTMISGITSPTNSTFGHSIVVNNVNFNGNSSGYSMDSNSSSPYSSNSLRSTYSSRPIKTRSVSASASIPGSASSSFLLNVNPVLPSKQNDTPESFKSTNTDYQPDSSPGSYSSVSHIRGFASADYDQQHQKYQHQLVNIDDDHPRRPRLSVNKSYTRNFILPRPESYPSPITSQQDQTISAPISSGSGLSKSTSPSSSLSSTSSSTSVSSYVPLGSSTTVSTSSAISSIPGVIPAAHLKYGTKSNAIDTIMTEDRPVGVYDKPCSALPIEGITSNTRTVEYNRDQSQTPNPNQLAHQLPNQFYGGSGSELESGSVLGSKSKVLDDNNSAEMGGMDVLLEAAGL